VKNYLRFFLDSFYRVSGEPEDQRDFLSRFYEIFLAESPEIRVRFDNTDMERQREMLAQSLHEMVDFATSRVASDRLGRVADRHSRRQRDIPPELYEVWLDSLIRTVREMDPLFCEEIELAWRVVLAPGIAYMKFRYDRF
jgi:hemoglobin-like flavoprotein